MSTDHQRYSIANQSAAIHAYAQTHDMRIVRSYSDPGRSGLTLKERPGLRSLLADVTRGNVDFTAILVYDVSRWGRFQDVDESAYYEFLCKLSGVRVVYCAEQFASDETPFASLIKTLKRTMAGEYSRELGVKIAAGKARIGGLGFRVGGIAGYGLRRQVLQDGLTPGIVLSASQRKAIQTDRVTLVPGPEEEIRVVRRIYGDCTRLGKSDPQIANDLNNEGVTCLGRPWTRALVKTILTNEKYVGNHIVGMFSQRLTGSQVMNPPEKWVRCDKAFEPIISSRLFKAAARARQENKKVYLPPAAILEALANVLKRRGKLTTAIINEEAALPSANTVYLRFGALTSLYKTLGYSVPRRYAHHQADRALKVVSQKTQDRIVSAIQALGIACRSDMAGLIVVADSVSVEVRACRFQGKPRKPGWRIAYKRNLATSVLVALRMEPKGKVIRDLLVVPTAVLHELPVFIPAGDDVDVLPFRHLGVDAAARALVRESSALRSVST